MTHLQSFIARHNLNDECDHGDIRVAVEAICEARALAFNTIGNIDSTSSQQGFVIQGHLNLLGRLFEQASGMLVCISAKSYESAEALARVVLEGAINLMYLSMTVHDKSLVAFIDTWLNEHSRKMDEWKVHALRDSSLEPVIRMIDERRGFISQQKMLQEQLVKELGLRRGSYRDNWPKETLIYSRPLVA